VWYTSTLTGQSLKRADEMGTMMVTDLRKTYPDLSKRPRVFKDRFDGRWSIEYRVRYVSVSKWLVCADYDQAILNALSLYDQHYQPFTSYSKVES
jgi:hypothetical protein